MTTTTITGLAVAALAAWTAGSPTRAEAQTEPVAVVATLPVYASIVEAIGGDQVRVTSIAHPNEDAHFVRPKPSFALDLRSADLFITTGLDLELWVPTLLDRAGNRDVLEGGRGYVTAYTGITLLDIPEVADRSQGDVHLYGNPHLHTDPLRVIQIARNITTGLRRVAPDRAEHWTRGLDAFTDRIHRASFGDALVDLLGGHNLEQLALTGTLVPFLEGREHQGRKLIDDLGGWLGRALPLRGREMVCYHKNWTYFEDRFGITCADYVESKPGIPPTPRHVAHLIELMRDQRIGVLLAASYYPSGRIDSVAERGGAVTAIVPVYPGARPGVDDYFDLVDTWIAELDRAFAVAARR
ncbi:MAG TPA: metal ABC transporter substrate-binding protein [Longimicrobiales bacterium]|jgi:ABC-type Zn uptake system ZnuABC Zn-binding protein ZnuA